MASKGVNKVILIGNLGNEPEVRYTTAGTAMATLSLATSETWKDKESGQPQEKTEWHRVVLFNRLGEIAGEYLHKGSKIYIEGSLRTRKWTDKNGQEKYTTEILANTMQMLDSKGSTLGAGNASAQSSGAMGGSNFSSFQNSAPEPAGVAMDEFDDQIPF